MMQFVPKECSEFANLAISWKFEIDWISLVWNWILLVWNWISLVWNWISLMWNWIQLVWNWISFLWNWISFVKNRPENGIVLLSSIIKTVVCLHIYIFIYFVSHFQWFQREKIRVEWFWVMQYPVYELQEEAWFLGIFYFF